MPLDTVLVLVVEDGQAGLVVELLQALHSDSNIVFRLKWSLLDTLEVVRLRNTSLSGVTPEGLGVGRVGGRDPRVARASPEPAVHIDGLKMVSVAAFVLEVAFPSAGPCAVDTVLLDDLEEHLVLPGRVEADEVHAPVPAEVATVEPVPILKLVPGFSPGEEIVVVANLHVGLSLHALLEDRSVQQRFSIRPNSGRSLTQSIRDKCRQ